MYAVFRSGGKQYRAIKGERVQVEKLDADEGTSVSFDEVLLVGEGSDVKIGSPLLSGTTVTATVLRQGKSRKVPVVKFKRRKNYLRQGTHRQFFTEVEITAIGAASSSRQAAKKPAADSAATEKPAAKKVATKKAVTKKAPTKNVGAKKTATKKPAAKKAAKKTASKKSDK